MILQYIFKSFITDIKLEFEEPSYSIKLSYGHVGKVFQFKPLKRAVKVVDKDVYLKFEGWQESDKYPFGGNYSLEYVPGIDQRYLGEFEMLENIYLNLNRIQITKFERT